MVKSRKRSRKTNPLVLEDQATFNITVGTTYLLTVSNFTTLPKKVSFRPLSFEFEVAPGFNHPSPAVPGYYFPVGFQAYSSDADTSINNVTKAILLTSGPRKLTLRVKARTWYAPINETSSTIVAKIEAICLSNQFNKGTVMGIIRARFMLSREFLQAPCSSGLSNDLSYLTSQQNNVTDDTQAGSTIAVVSATKDVPELDFVEVRPVADKPDN